MGNDPHSCPLEHRKRCATIYTAATATSVRASESRPSGPPTPSSPEFFLHLPGAPAPGLGRGGTFSFSMGRVTLYMSMVLMMMAGVVRKKKRRKRKVLIAMKRAHQWKRRTDRCFLGRTEEGDALRTPGLSPQTQPVLLPACQLWTRLPWSNSSPWAHPHLHETALGLRLSHTTYKASQKNDPNSFCRKKLFPQRLGAFHACGGVGLGVGGGCDAHERNSPAGAVCGQ